MSLYAHQRSVRACIDRLERGSQCPPFWHQPWLRSPGRLITDVRAPLPYRHELFVLTKLEICYRTLRTDHWQDVTVGSLLGLGICKCTFYPRPPKAQILINAFDCSLYLLPSLLSYVRSNQSHCFKFVRLFLLVLTPL